VTKKGLRILDKLYLGHEIYYMQKIIFCTDIKNTPVSKLNTNMGFCFTQKCTG